MIKNLWAEILTFQTPLHKNLMGLKIEAGRIFTSYLVLVQHLERHKGSEQEVYFIYLE